MCGIAGAVGRITERVRAAVRAMSAAQVHRGPDGKGTWSSLAQGASGEGVVLAHRRLAILDVSDAGAQPMLDARTGNVISYNGEVYNFLSLRNELSERGHSFSSRCDTEVLLAAYTEWGLDAVSRFRGMFAFALWDAEQSRLHLLRDRLGVKPLYYCQVPDHDEGRVVLFASEIRALLASELIPRHLDPTALSTYLWNGYVTGPRAMVRGVKILPAGTHTTLSADGKLHEPRPYWTPPPSSPRTNAVASLQEQLREAVEMRLISDVPLGVFLSGGIDSSAVSALASLAAPGQINTFNLGFREPEFDESPFAEAVAKALGTQHTTVRISSDTFKAHLPAALESIDQPTFDGVNTYLISRAVREAGITVALAGMGGDELFGGYRSFTDVPRARRVARLTRLIPVGVLRKLAGLAATARMGRSGEVPPQTRWGKLGDVLAARGDLLSTFQLSYGMFTEAFLGELQSRRSVAPTDYGFAPAVAVALREQIRDEPDLHALSLLELRCFITERLMRDSDAASMAVSLEMRVPLLDHRVVESASSVDATRRFKPLGRKALLQQVGLPGLDRSLFDRPKAGFVLPFSDWCRDSLRDDVEATFEDASLCQQVGLEHDALMRLWRSFQSGAPGMYWSRLWTLFVLLRWCRAHRMTLA